MKTKKTVETTVSLLEVLKPYIDFIKAGETPGVVRNIILTRQEDTVHGRVTRELANCSQEDLHRIEVCMKVENTQFSQQPTSVAKEAEEQARKIELHL